MSEDRLVGILLLGVPFTGIGSRVPLGPAPFLIGVLPAAGRVPVPVASVGDETRRGEPDLFVVSRSWMDLVGAIPPVGCRRSVCFMGSVRVGVDSLDTTGDGFLVVMVVSFRPLGSVRVVTVALGSLLASFFIAAFWAAMAVCFLVVKPAVVSPGVATPVSMLLRAALVRVEAEGQRQQ